MPPDESKPTSKNDPSQADTPPYKKWWMEEDSPAARRKWSPERRKQEADDLRLLRQMKKVGLDWSKTSIKVGDETYTIVCRFPDPSRQNK